ncbi:hypothetical protein T484DRAFT_1781612, partial [Baffinella frigidus]
MDDGDESDNERAFGYGMGGAAHMRGDAEGASSREGGWGGGGGRGMEGEERVLSTELGEARQARWTSHAMVVKRVRGREPFRVTFVLDTPREWWGRALPAPPDEDEEDCGVGRKRRTCSVCDVPGHDKRTCPSRKRRPGRRPNHQMPPPPPGAAGKSVAGKSVPRGMGKSLLKAGGGRDVDMRGAAESEDEGEGGGKAEEKGAARGAARRGSLEHTAPERLLSHPPARHPEHGPAHARPLAPEEASGLAPRAKAPRGEGVRWEGLGASSAPSSQRDSNRDTPGRRSAPPAVLRAPVVPPFAQDCGILGLVGAVASVAPAAPTPEPASEPAPASLSFEAPRAFEAPFEAPRMFEAPPAFEALSLAPAALSQPTFEPFSQSEADCRMESCNDA